MSWYFICFSLFFILLSKKKPLLFYIFSVLLFGCFLYFAFYKLKIEIPLSEQWYDYVNPMNQVFLFLGGYLIGYLFNNVQFSNKGPLIILFVALAVFFFYPAEGNIAAGINRIIFSACCFFACFALYKISYRFPEIIDKPLLLLGEISYSLYLLHPIVWLSLKLFLFTPLDTISPVSPLLKMISTIVLSIIISYCIYHYVERYFMKVGRSISAKTTTIGNIYGNKKKESLEPTKTV